MDVVNQWNINMNTLGAGDYQVPREIMVWGFTVQTVAERQSHIFLEENECVRSWYNAHCDAAYRQLSAIRAESLQEKAFNEAYLDIVGEELLLSKMLPIKKVGATTLDIEAAQDVAAFSLIWNGLMGGRAENQLSSADIKEHGYGLIYYENAAWQAFFDNRLAGMFHKLQELQKNNIRPICVAIQKEKRKPIPVAVGRKLLLRFVQDQTVKNFYQQMQLQTTETIEL